VKCHAGPPLSPAAPFSFGIAGSVRGPLAIFFYCQLLYRQDSGTAASPSPNGRDFVSAIKDPTGFEGASGRGGNSSKPLENLSGDRRRSLHLKPDYVAVLSSRMMST
jgi:hypothetical protein